MKYRVTLNGVEQQGEFTAQEIVDKTEQMLLVLSMYGPVSVTYTPIREKKDTHANANGGE